MPNIFVHDFSKLAQNATKNNISTYFFDLTKNVICSRQKITIV